MSIDLDELLPGLYEELRELAAAHMRHERAAHTLQPTALAHEVYLRLRDAIKVESCGRTQFLAIASRAMRQILVDHARRRNSAKRGGGQAHDVLTEAPAEFGVPQVDLLDLDEALNALAALDERRARVEAARPALVVRADIEALGGEADPAHEVGRPPDAPPKAAILAIEGLKILARMGLPGADAILGPADLDHAW